MEANHEQYHCLGTTVINADMPKHIQYTSVADRMAAMRNPLSMPGELEIIAVTNVLKRQKDRNGNMINRYGTSGYPGAPLVVQYSRLDNDVAHYDYVHRTSGMEIIKSLSPIPKAQNKRKRTRKAELATLLTSSLYKDLLVQKQASSKGKLRNWIKERNLEKEDRHAPRPSIHASTENKDKRKKVGAKQSKK